jgi:hypothetical protein
MIKLKLNRTRLFLYWTLFLFISGSVVSQNQVQYLYLDEPIYDYIDYLINSGKTIPDFVFSQPYEKNDNLFAFNEKKESQYFNNYWNGFYSEKDLSSQIQLNDRVNYANTLFNRYKISFNLHYANENISLANRTIVDQDYKQDTLFAYVGDLSESDHWLYGRVNDAYINLRFNRLNLFFGRMHRNWGPINSNSLILSNNAYTYDHFLFSYTFEKVKLSLIFAQLENLDAIKINRTTYEQSIILNARKYMVGHRLDINFYDTFQIALTEMAMYGGENRDIELALFNPMNFYYALQRNDKKAISGLWALDIFFKPIKKISVYGQFLLDDIIVNNDPGVDDRKRFPDRLGLMVSLRAGDFLQPGSNIDLSYVRIWNRTYQSKVTYENYHYGQLGLGYPCASCEEFKLKIGLWSLFPFFIENETIFGKYGNVSLTDVFPFVKETFPIKPVTNNFVNLTTIKYFYNTSLSTYLSMYYFKNKNHYLNRIYASHKFRIELGVSFLLSKGIINL